MSQWRSVWNKVSSISRLLQKKNAKTSTVFNPDSTSQNGCTDKRIPSEKKLRTFFLKYSESNSNKENQKDNLVVKQDPKNNPKTTTTTTKSNVNKANTTNNTNNGNNNQQQLTIGEEELIGLDGLQKLCLDLQLEPENVLILVLSWKLKAERAGYFTEKEWMEGMRELECDNVNDLKKKLEELWTTLLISRESGKERNWGAGELFKDFYAFAFHFSKENGQAKHLEVEFCCSLLNMFMDKQNHIEEICFFLREVYNNKSISLDQWLSILDFSFSILEDFSNYEEDGAWPVLLDEFVEFQKKMKKMESQLEEGPTFS